MRRLLLTLGELLALALLCSFSSSGAIRPSFYLRASSWNATEILVLAPTSQAGVFRVTEAVKGELAPGTTLELPGLTPSHETTATLSELSKGDFSHRFVGVPPVRPDDRLIAFLRRPGALPEYIQRLDLPVQTTGWQPANQFEEDLRTSTVWIQDGITYVFSQSGGGPADLTPLRMSEAELRREIESVLQLRRALDRAVATADPVDRSRQLAVLVRSGNEFARSSALRKLERGGQPEADVLLDLLSDQSLLGWHQDFIAALAGTGVADSRFAEFLDEETAYWSQTCHTLRPGWWNTTPKNETQRNHYTRSYALVTQVHRLNPSVVMPAVLDFAAAWRKCPPIEKHEKTNQITDILKVLIDPAHP